MNRFSEISQEALARTKKCRYKFICLKSDRYELCPVTSYSEDEGLLLMGACRPKCPYNESLGCITRCTCPVRYEILKKYGR